MSIRRSKIAWLILILIGMSNLITMAMAEDVGPLLNYCAPPFVPPCVETLKDHDPKLAACENEMDAYVASVFKYRSCLQREMDRAVRETNAALAKLRCAQGRKPC